MLCSAHEVMYWPGMQAAILQDSANCFVYVSYSSSLPKEPMLSHEIPHGSRKFISQELFKQSGRLSLLFSLRDRTVLPVGAGGGGLLRYISHIGMCRLKGYGFWDFLV